MQRLRYLGLALIAACSSKSAPQHAPELADYLYGISGTDEPKRAAAVAMWTLSREEWNRVVVEPYKAVYDEYVREISVMQPGFIAMLSVKHPVQTRAHFAGDPLMSRGQAITRWALPTLAPARIAELTGNPPLSLDAVFVDVGGQWRAIVGLDAIVKRRAAECATVFERIEPRGGACIEAAWAVADAMLRDQRAKFTHACSIATNACRR